ncbi:hypothetical protein [Phenylobacterium soli]|uniref:Lectin-like protein BA14k n=1 Tax=Phenylobacterium soli TaxID=2170551 RepID=A0A328AAD0_9CAUL|nr:hypothetical protein [Phenylobacterium soli]RAK51693.1 hypothetical protein DJ017_17830 [Phenylobacterium soli]
MRIPQATKAISILSIGVSAAMLAGLPACAARPANSAFSAERFGTPASYRAPAARAVTGHGYSARSRHIADCLATYRNYDPDTDRVTLRPGVSRKCGL